MNIYLLTQDENTGYDTYDSMVVIAENEEDAVFLSFIESYMIEESDYSNSHKEIWRNYIWKEWNSRSWSKHIEIELLAENVDREECVICSSFNAG